MVRNMVGLKEVSFNDFDSVLDKRVGLMITLWVSLTIWTMFSKHIMVSFNIYWIQQAALQSFGLDEVAQRIVQNFAQSKYA